MLDLDDPNVRISLSWAQQVCAWTDLLPEEHRPAGDQVLLDAAPEPRRVPGIKRAVTSPSSPLLEAEDRGPSTGSEGGSAH